MLTCGDPAATDESRRIPNGCSIGREGIGCCGNFFFFFFFFVLFCLGEMRIGRDGMWNVGGLPQGFCLRLVDWHLSARRPVLEGGRVLWRGS